MVSLAPAPVDTTPVSRRSARPSAPHPAHVARPLPPTRYEQLLDAPGPAPQAATALAALLAEASRDARRATTPQTAHERAVVEVAAGVAAPTLVAWVLWMMQSAQRDGLRRLYFISRDGQILLEVARRLERALQTGLDLRYLYGSRRAFHLAGEPHRIVAEAARSETCSLADLAGALGVPVEALLDLAPDAVERAARPLPRRVRERWVDAFQGPAFDALLAPTVRSTREALHAYLRQEGWGDGTPAALVDVGWRGTTSRALTDALPDDLAPPDRLYYYGLLEDAHELAGPDLAPRMRAWAFDAAAGTGQLPFMRGTISLVETFCSGDHGCVRGYTWADGLAVPVLADRQSAASRWSLALFRRAVGAAADAVAAGLLRGAARPDADVRHQTWRTAQAFWETPTRDEARAWGAFPVESGLSSAATYPLGRALGLHAVRRFLEVRELRPRASWGEGSVALSPWPVRLAVRSGWRLRAASRRVARRVARRLRGGDARWPTPSPAAAGDNLRSHTA